MYSHLSFIPKRSAMPDFYKYFKENMDSLGLPAPESLFGTLQLALANATILMNQIDKFGTRVTLGELGAATKLEGLGVAAACTAAFYVGAVIGSIAVATGRTLSGGTTIGEVLFCANQRGLYRPWLTETLQRYPGIYKADVASRSTYRFHAALV
ncbi:MAG TPA: hypothetical protein PK620_17175 [Denitromonas sp.]|uniref:hypothetical protein n=1 Tax=Denitromonas sp. TaxID=2734609 RepID=UPI001D5A61D9|nr:hypothetical protein [Rhodocyclaceae bacterium]HPR06580.1 hypothetical protein [Denitromonas sp.]HQU90547.1 hypothetical protein [Denitromonas sp.]HQV16641.1 hypothetical protein [Denitromonas sp.]